MAGRTNVMADKALGLYKGIAASPVAGMWATLFTTNPTVDHATSHGAVEWGPARVRVYPDSGSGSPSFSAISDLSPTVRYITNVGNITWTSITMTASPSTMIGIGFFDASSGGELKTWYPIDEDEWITKEDGENVVLAPGAVKITAD